MTLLKRFAGHEKLSLHLARYLEGDDASRVRGMRICVQGCTSPGEWARAMDARRAAFGNDTAHGDKPGVFYRHFIISPDPESGAGIDACMELACTWAREHFGEIAPEDGSYPYSGNGSIAPENRGALGTYDWVAIAHDDGTNGVPHVHIVVNNTDHATGRRLHIDNADNDAMWDRLQALSAERGLPTMPDAKTHRRLEAEAAAERKRAIRRKAFLTAMERRLINEGGYCWKQQLRDLIDCAAWTSKDAGEFAEAIASYGVGITETVNPKGDIDYIFAHPDNPSRYRASGYRLGVDAYALAAVEERIFANRMRYHYVRSPRVRGAVRAYIVNDMLLNSGTAVHSTAGDALAALSDALAFNAAFKIGCMADYDSCRAHLSRLHAQAPEGERRDGILASLERCERARAEAAASGMFEGVRQERPWSMESSPAASAADGKPKRKAGASGKARAPARAKSGRKASRTNTKGKPKGR